MLRGSDSIPRTFRETDSVSFTEIVFIANRVTCKRKIYLLFLFRDNKRINFLTQSKYFSAPMDPNQQNQNVPTQTPVIQGYYVMPTPVPAPYYNVAPANSDASNFIFKIKLIYYITDNGQPTLQPQQFYIPQNHTQQTQFYVPQVITSKSIVY
jgi:hypothetical protein